MAAASDPRGTFAQLLGSAAGKLALIVTAAVIAPGVGGVVMAGFLLSGAAKAPKAHPLQGASHELTQPSTGAFRAGAVAGRIVNAAGRGGAGHVARAGRTAWSR